MTAQTITHKSWCREHQTDYEGSLPQTIVDPQRRADMCFGGLVQPSLSLCRFPDCSFQSLYRRPHDFEPPTRG